MKTKQEKLVLKKKQLWIRQILNTAICMIVMLIIYGGVIPGISYIKGPENIQNILPKMQVVEENFVIEEEYVQLEADNLYGPYNSKEKTITSEGKNGVKSSFDVSSQCYLYILPDKEHAISIQVQGNKDISLIEEYIKKIEVKSEVENNTFFIKGGLWQLGSFEKKEAVAYFEKLMDNTNLEESSIYSYGITMNRLGGQTAYMNLIYLVIFVIVFIYLVIGWIIFIGKFKKLQILYEGESIYEKQKNRKSV